MQICGRGIVSVVKKVFSRLKIPQLIEHVNL